MNIRLRVASLSTALLGVVAPATALAQGLVERVQQGVDTAGKPAGFQPGGPELIDIIGGVISVALSFIGIVLLLFLLYAGFLWMTAGGNEEKVKEARGIIRNAIIGLVVTVSAFAIANFVLERVSSVGTGEGGASEGLPRQ